MGGRAVRVDWYTATVDGLDGGEALAWLCRSLPEHEGLELTKDGAIRRNHYDHAVGVLDGKTPVADVRWGGNGDGCSVELKGSVAEEAFRAFRRAWPRHRVSRMDVAVDRTASGLFGMAYESLKAAAGESRPKITVDHEGDWTWRERPGLTAYFGSKESYWRIALYQKGYERLARGAAVADPDHTRLELRFRGSNADKLVKAHLASVEPVELWGLSPFTRKALDLFVGIEAQPVQRAARVRDDERAYAALMNQYGGFLGRHGGSDDPDAFWEQLRRDAEGFLAHKLGKRSLRAA